MGPIFGGPSLGQKPATPNVTSGVAGWLAAGPAAGHYSSERPGQNRAQKWNPKMDPKSDPQKWGPKIESLFKLSIGVAFGAHFWGPLLGIIFGSHFLVFFGYFLNRFGVKLLDLNIQARAYNGGRLASCRAGCRALFVGAAWPKSGPKTEPKNGSKN